MPCTTCEHTMNGIGHATYHCPRCGTVRNPDGSVFVPALINRCRNFESTIAGVCAEHAFRWKSLGIAEAINTPNNRGPK